MPKLETHKLAQFLYERTGAAGIVVQTSDPASLVGQYSDDTPLFIISNFLQQARHKKSLAGQLPNATWLTKKDTGEDFLRDKIQIYNGFSNSRPARKEISRSMDETLITMVTAPSKDKKKLQRLVDALPAKQTVLSGKAKLYENASAKDQVSVIGGQLLNVRKNSYPLLKVLAIIPQYNERDVIGSTVNHLLAQGVDVHIIDNWSTDGSYELVQAMAKKAPGRITYERFPSKKTNTYDWTAILKQVTDVAYEMKGQYDWATLNDADELRWSPWKDVTLQKAFSFLDSLGYNCIDYTVFNFTPTKDGFNEHDDVSSFFDYGEFGAKEAYFVQVKSWKNSQNADLASSGGHHVLFPKLRVFPFKFLLCHYPLRSSKQAKQKIFQDRNPRFPESEKKQGWHQHYLGVAEDASFIHDQQGLIHFDKAAFQEEYLYERISGVGIPRK